jgi:hypothetical protein
MAALDNREVADMSRPRLIPLFAALAATLILATGADASQSRPVTITVLTTVEGNDPFVATGGVVCSTGEVSNGSIQFVGAQRGSGAQILIDKHFACADGTFEILLRVSLDFAACDTAGTWSVLSGTDAYARLHGSGRLSGESDCEDTTLDAYVGSMHLD